VLEYSTIRKIKVRSNILICFDLTSRHITYKLFVRNEVAKAIEKKLSDIHHPIYLFIFVCEVNDVKNITTVVISEVQYIIEHPLGVPGKVLQSYVSNYMEIKSSMVL